MEECYQTLPKAFVEKLNRLIPHDHLQSALHSFCEHKPKTFRTNLLKTSTQDLIKQLRSEKIVFEQVPWYTDAFILKDDPIKLTQTDAYKQGLLYIQGLSSMLPVLVLDPQFEEKILDLAAAPGSKTTQIAMYMQNTGEIIANDISRTRLFKLKETLRLQGVTNATIVNMPGERLWQRYPSYFDKALVDVPCSMEGRFEANDPKTFADWTPGKVRHLAPKQGFLLRSAISATKPGGVIVYSTCTLSPEENEGVIDWILKKEGAHIQLEDITISGIDFLPGITSWGEKAYNPEVAKTKRILPNNVMEGFFVAKIRKMASNF